MSWKGEHASMNGIVDQVIKHSFMYSYLLSQPFGSYVDAYPVIQNKALNELTYSAHDELTRVLLKKGNEQSISTQDIEATFEILTERALREFQQNHEIIIPDRINNETLINLIDIEKALHLQTIKNFSATIYPRTYSEEIKVVQEALYFFDYYVGEIDGLYGPLTKEALEQAEEKYGLSLLDQITEATLVELDLVSEQGEKNDVPSRVEETVPEDAEESVEANETATVSSSEDRHPVATKQHIAPQVTEVARDLIGTPYVWGGDSPSGFDCSGFTHYVYQTQDITIPRTVSDTWNFATLVDSPSIGDLVFFETYKPGPSHMGIYLGDGKFVHAGTSNGVVISELNESYWKSKYLGAKRIAKP